MTDLARAAGIDSGLDEESDASAAIPRSAATWFMPSPRSPIAPARITARRERSDVGCEQQAGFPGGTIGAYPFRAVGSKRLARCEIASPAASASLIRLIPAPRPCWGEEQRLGDGDDAGDERLGALRL